MGERIKALYSFIKKGRNIRQNIRELMRGIKLFYIRALEEKSVLESYGKVKR